MWINYLPHMLRKPEPNPDFTLLPKEKLKEYLDGVSDETAQKIKKDIDYLEKELFHFFKRRDYEAVYHQNRYRRFQIIFILLALSATVLGSLQAISLGSSSNALAFFAFFETAIALVATFVATISSFEPPVESYVQNRRIAEYLRQEFFRYLVHADPYDDFGTDDADRERHLALRAAEINQGKSPDIRRSTTTSINPSSSSASSNEGVQG